MSQTAFRSASQATRRTAAVAPRAWKRELQERRSVDDARAHGHLDVLLLVSRVLARHDARDPARGLPELIVPAVGDWCTVDLIDSDGLRRVAAHHRADGVAACEPALQATHPRWAQVGRSVARTGQATLIDVREDGPMGADARAVLAGLGMACAAIVPIRTAERVLGVLTVAAGPDRRALRPSDVAAFEELGNRVALAIERDETEGALLAARQQTVDLEGVRRIAHDFGNLLTRIVGYTELAERQLIAGERPDEEVAQIRAAAEAAVRLTRASTDTSAPGSYGPLGSVDAGEVAAVLEPALHSLVGDDRLRVVSRGPAPVAMASSGVEHILRNLVANAGRANDERPGAGTVEVFTGPAPGRPGHTILGVVDDGVGMDPHLLAACRSDGFTTRSGRGGSGRGLAMVECLVEQAGGDLHIRSEPQVGTTVTVRLPHPT